MSGTMGCGHPFSAIKKTVGGSQVCGTCYAKTEKRIKAYQEKMTEPDWTGECIVCGAKPILPATEMCGPCTFGEADTMGGEW